MQQQTQIVNYKCPNCGAPMEFGIASQKWECHFCESSFSLEELPKIEAQEGSERPEGPEQATWVPETFQDHETVAYTCPDCGGKVLADRNTASTFCPYCHSPTVIAGRLSGEYRPARVLPFQLGKEQAVESLLKLCKKKPFLPRAFRQYVEKGEITGLYVPYWLFSCTLHSFLQGTGKRVQTWSDSRYRYTKTDVYQVERAANIPFQLLPVDGSSRMDDRLMESIEPFDYSKLQTFNMQYLSGHFAESFDVDSKTSSQRFFQRAQSAAQDILRGSANGYSSLTVNSCTHRQSGLDNIYVMLPVWMISVKFKGKIYTYAMNGQSGKSSGKLPMSMGRFFAWFGGFAAVFSVIAMLGGMFL